MSRGLFCSLLLSLCFFSFSQSRNDTVFFDSGSHNLRAKGLEKLKKVPFEKVRLEGRADHKGDTDYNLALSKRRVNAVKEFLLSNGHEEKNVTWDFYGESKQIGEANTEKGLQNNRCVVIHYVKDEKLKPFPQPETKEVVFFNANGTSMRLENGVQVIIPPFCFESDPSGQVTFKITSYMNKSDFILSGLQSMAGDQLLESAGMFYLEASNNKGEVKLRKGKNIRIDVPNTSGRDGFEYFQGVQNTSDSAGSAVNWVLPNVNSRARYVASGTFTVSGIDKTYYLHENSETIFQLAEGHPRSYAAYTSPKFVIRSEHIIKAFKSQKKSVSFEIKVHVEKRVLKSYKLTTTSGTLNKSIEKALEKAFKNAKWKKKKETYDLVFKGQFGEYQTSIPLNGLPVKEDAVTMNTDLGWVNCDRFAHSGRQLMNIEFPVQPDITVYLVFQNINSIMRSWYWTPQGILFKNIPIDEPYTVLAFRQQEDGVIVAEKSHNDPEPLDFKKITEEEFVSILSKY